MGLPEYAEVADAVLDFKLKAAGTDVRSFLTSALEGRAEASGALEGVEAELFAAMDAVEADSGPLAAGNTAAFQALAKRVEVRCRTSRNGTQPGRAVPGAVPTPR